MSVSKRLWDLARSNLNDFASGFRDDDIEPGAQERARIREEVDPTVGKKAGRAARKVRDAAEEAWERAFEAAQARNGRGEADASEVDRWYETLELERGADLEAVRKSYRRLMRQYHPDRFATDPEKYEAANKIAAKITQAYNGLRQILDLHAAPG